MGLYWNCTHSGEILSVIWVYTGTVPIMGDIECDMGLYWNCTHNGGY